LQLPIFENYRTVKQPFEERKWGEHENGEKWERKEKNGRGGQEEWKETGGEEKGRREEKRWVRNGRRKDKKVKGTRKEK